MATASAKVTISNELGLHARPAGLFCQVAASFESSIAVTRVGGAETVDGKSMLGLLQLAAAAGTELEIRADGADAEAAVTRLTALVEAGFAEG